MLAQGFGAPETTAAFARAPPSWRRRQGRARAIGGRLRPVGAAACTRGELPSMREHGVGLPAATLRRGPIHGGRRRASRPPGSASSPAIIVEARDHCERALALFHPGREDDARRFASASTPGVPRRPARRLRRGLWARSIARVAHRPQPDADRPAITHVGDARFWRMMRPFRIDRGDHARAALNAARARPPRARARADPVSRVRAEFIAGWARGRLGAPRRRARRCAAAPSSLAPNKNVWHIDGLFEDCAGRGRGRGGRLHERACASSTKRWRPATAPDLARSKPNCIGRAAKSC